MEEIANFLISKIFDSVIFIDSLGRGMSILLVGLLPIYICVYMYLKGVFKNKVRTILSFFFSFFLSFFISALIFIVYIARSGI
ncbi:hypothetical protein BSPWISOXPB_5794 [uncultured Gammaproteobacteria bacterium]|nr:hypothetical protein BSPWISOXPB_7237 [uncultured Gammaproteobacteria bacterium]VVM25599.1 hypothetical protein BSPWISOXPB_1893 [uncultured Gammaproteobacteria bacterium]VVM26173.1 hypothetical protein BSPWISOXPB_5794 [uncultured Gammaproteobacteria bacterium]